MEKKTFDKEDLLLYAITDRSWLGEETLYEQVEKALKGGITMLQLREKHLPEEEIIKFAKELRELCHSYGVPLIINDSVDIALAADADGVHVGQSDTDAAEARRRLGPSKIVGVTAKTMEQAESARRQGADYLGVGAVYATGTKKDAVGISHDTLQEIAEKSGLPIVAIGGISAENAKNLKGRGISGIAVVSAVFAAKDITKAASELKQIAGELVK